MTVTRDKSAWLKGGNIPCNEQAPPLGRAYRLVLLGAPGVGKGTQAEMLAQKLGACHLSTGDVFRAAKSLPAKDRSPALEAALGYMQRGELVPDETVINIVRERASSLRCKSGFLLDGFPRTVAQAESLAKILKAENVRLDGVLSYEMPIDRIVERLGGRRTCEKCKAVYHVANMPSKVEGVCDHCGGKLIIREDDRPEAIRVRMQVYQKSTAPLADFYRKQGILVEIQADGSPQSVFERTMSILSDVRL